ncbi:MAG: aldehyde dehydrogenase family protein [Rudaea sp.]|uniref:aldehyde dehydrogenase family protein n=1 Tax=Rudaea sp. TaxID=2136325 RepID=UPI0039E2C3CC
MATYEPVLIAGKWRASRDAQSGFRAFDPATGEEIGPAFPISGAIDVEAALAAASAAASELAAMEPARIAAFLDAYAAAIETDAQALVELAHAETALPREPRLAKVELPRTTNQLRQAAQAVRASSWTQATIDTQAGLRSHFGPLGKPVLVFGPNNFPFAYNAVAGGDFASAIAARNPVVAKAHPLQPATSKRLAELAHRAVLDAGLPAASVQMLYHLDNELGARLAGDARIGAIGFTGSRTGGLALKAAADPSGIPVYAEMSSVNPVFLLPGALAERASELAQEFFASNTMASGQFCTNPGIVIVPHGTDGDAFVAAASASFANAQANVLLSQGVLDHFRQGLAALTGAGAKILAQGKAATEPGYRQAPTLLGVDGKRFVAAPKALQTEVFGPASLIVRADGIAEMIAIAQSFEGNLTGSVYAGKQGSVDDTAAAGVARALRPRVGRLIGNKMPTGVAVSAAMNHGGPYPSTSHSGFTAVGMPAAIRRFAALHCYDNVPAHLLPADLRDANPGGVQRLIDGRWTTDDVTKATSA